MPELPEVETTRRGLAALMVGETITRVRVRESRLRWPVPAALSQQLVGREVERVERRAKYLLIGVRHGTLIVHLGMSGSLQRVMMGTPARRHDHIDVELGHAVCIRYHDPRRFGSMHWTDDLPERHFLLEGLGPEPLGSGFTGDYLYARARNRTVAVKNFIMNAQVVAGVGNIYASEALYHAGIHPRRAAGRISRSRYALLVEAVRETLQRAIEAGGTTLRDFVSGEGERGYFGQQLFVYGRHNEACERCGNLIRSSTIGQRSSFFCPRCQH